MDPNIYLSKLMDLGYETAKGNPNAFAEIYGEDAPDPLCEVCGGLKTEVLDPCKCAQKLARDEEDAMEKVREEANDSE